MTVPIITHQRWNDMIDRLRAHSIQSITELPGNGYRHPWNVSPQWNATLSRWECTIQQGFVAGRDAEVRVLYQDAPSPTVDRLKREKRPQLTPDTPVDAYLTESPRMVLANLRAIGADAAPTSVTTTSAGDVVVRYESVPEYFRALGVGEPPNVSSSGDFLSQQVDGVAGQDAQSRLLRATEITLYIDRPAVAIEPVPGAPREYEIVYRRPPGSRLRPYLRTSSSVPQIPVELAPFETRDQWSLATVYFVSPPGAAYWSTPDASWTPHVQHHDFFWNCAYRLDLPDPAAPRQYLTLVTGLAGGVGDLLNNALLDLPNSTANTLLQLLRSTSIRGVLWTI